ncbi:MAG: hypothetical protein FJ293_14265 [Planctomycetes bacterium]|nr:hypothetical protein [Planctomycetota bacterium]
MRGPRCSRVPASRTRPGRFALLAGFAALLLAAPPARAEERLPAPAPTLAAARAAAAASKRPILVMVLNDAEPACRRMLEQVYSDPEVLAALDRFVLLVSSPDTHPNEAKPRGEEVIESCMKYPGVRCSEHQAVEREIRPLVADAAGNVIVPSHLVLDGDGQVLVKRPYAMRKPGFLEFLAASAALTGATVDPAAPVGARSPAVEKLAKALREAKDGRAREEAARALASDASPEREAAFLEALGRMRNAEERGEAVRALGRRDHQPWAPTIAALLDEKDRHVRNCAVVTLEEMAATAAVEDLLRLHAGEKDPEIRKDVVRALGPCGVGNDDAKQVVLAQLESPKEALRSAAALSAGALLKGDAQVAAAIEARWKKERVAAVRLALVWGIGESGDEGQAKLLEKLVAKEKDDDVLKIAAVTRVRLEGKSIEQAGKALGKGGGKEARRLLGAVFDDDKIVRNFIRDTDRKVSGKQ